MGIPAAITGVGGWTVGPVVGRRPAGVARDAVHPGTGARAVLVVVDGRFTGRGLPDPETVARAAIVGSPAVMPMLDAGLLEDGARWYVTPASPGPVLDPSAGCSPRRAATIVEAVARALGAVHAAGLVHGLVGPDAVVPALGRHSGRPVSQTLLLDTGVAALLGDRTDDLARASGVSLPADRGPAADVHALGALLLRLLTAAAPAGPALAALPVPMRALLSAMLDEHPSRRPSADAVADSLAGLREGLLATGPIDVQRPVPAAPAPVVSARPSAAPWPAPVVAPRSAPVPVQAARVALAPAPPALVPLAAAAAGAAPAAAPAPLLPPLTQQVPAPVPAPHTIESPIVVPRSAPTPAPSLWTGPVPVASSGRPRARRVQRFLLLAGGVGLAGALVGVLTHLPVGHQDEDQAVAAAGENRVLAIPATGSPSASASGATGAAAPSSSRSTASRVAPAAPPAFAAPVVVLPSPLAASATSSTPSRNTTAPTKHGGSPASTPTASQSPSSGSTGPTGSTGSSGPTSPASTAPSSPASDPVASTPTDSGSPAGSAPTDSSSPSDSATADPAPSDTTTTDPAASDAPASDPPTSDAPSSDPATDPAA